MTETAPRIEWPPGLLELGELAGSGEPLWALERAPAAIDWLESGSLAIVAIEVYGKVELARGVFQRELTIEPGWRDGETWARYVARAAAQARERLRSDRARSGAADLYFLAAIAEPPSAPLTAGARAITLASSERGLPRG